MRASRSFMLLGLGLLVPACYRSAELPLVTSPSDAGSDAPISTSPSDASTDAPFVPPDADVSSCGAPASAFACGTDVDSAWSGTTPLGALPATLRLESASAEGFLDCATLFSGRWSLDPAGAAPTRHLLFYARAPAGFWQGTLPPLETCTLTVADDADGGTAVSTPCTFTGCLEMRGAEAVLIGRLSADADGFDLDLPISLPLCGISVCL